MTHKLTRTQLDALAHLHRNGRQYPVGRGRMAIRNDGWTARYSRRTLDALVAAGVARWWVDCEVLSSVAPTLNAYANGFGNWHVAVPRELADQGAAIARAVIAGEVWARESQAYIAGWRPRVERVPGSITDVYREV